MEDDQNAQGEGGMNRPLVQLPRFGALRHHDGFLNRVIAQRVPINGVPVRVLHKRLRWNEAVAGYDILKVYEGEGANDLLSTLTEEEWQRAAPAPAETYRDFVMVYATGPDNVEYELLLRHGVHEDEPPYYDLTHGWSRVVFDYGLRAGDYVVGDGYRDVEGERLRLELRFYSGDSNQNVQEERDDVSGPQSENEDEGEGGGNVIESSSANGGSAAVAVSRERNQAPPPAARTARVRLPRFLNPEQPAKTHSVTTDPDGGGGAVLVLEKDEYELRPRHRVLKNEPLEYDLTHGWSRVMSDFGLKAGNRVEAWGNRDIKDNQLRLKLKFIRDIKDNPNVQEENQEEGEEEGEGEGGGSAAAAA